MPLRVSGVPPLLVSTITRVSASSPSIVEHALDAVGIGVVDEVDVHLVAGRIAEGVGDELRSERRSADADRQHVLELRRVGGLIFAPCTLAANVLIAATRLANLLGDLRRRARVRRAQPVMPDHPLLVGIGDRALSSASIAVYARASRAPSDRGMPHRNSYG